LRLFTGYLLFDKRVKPDRIRPKILRRILAGGSANVKGVHVEHTGDVYIS